MICNLKFFVFQLSLDLATMKSHEQAYSTVSLSLLLLACNLLGTWACPSTQCECESHNGRLIIKCSKKVLDAIPEFSSDVTEYDELTLANNRIRSVPKDAFNGLKIKYLDLSNNPISNIDSEAFSGLESLTTKLVLHVDGMTQFPTTALSTLVNLRNLELKGFAMTILPQNALDNLSKLETLTLKSCQLSEIKSSDFSSQHQFSLLELNLPGNALTSVPTAAIASLQNMATLNLAQNKISTIGLGAFDGVQKLEILDLSKNGVRQISNNGFADLSQTLHVLHLHNNHLNDREIQPLRILGQLRVLDLKYNSIVNIPSGFFTYMQQLKEADFTKNTLSYVTKSIFQGLGDSVKVLNFAENQIAKIESGTFESLKGLEELYLDQQPDLSGVLNERTFGGLEQSLRVLSINRVKFSSGNWAAVKILAGLQTLRLAHNNIINVPDSTFLQLNQMTKLDLSYNDITSLSQKSLYGLQGSLTSINLENNQISTLDNCVFYQFDKLKTIRLKENPLNCDCRLRWLRTWLDRYDAFELLTISWKCAPNLQHANRLFRELSTNDLTCESQVTTPECHDLRSVTQTTTTTPPPHHVWPKTLFINISQVSDTSIMVSWIINGTGGINGFTVDHQVTNTVAAAPQKVDCPKMARQCPVTGLEASTTYMVCVTLWYSGSTERDNQKACEDVTTKVPAMHVSTDTSPRMQIILGSILGVLVLIVIVGFIVILIVRYRRRQEPSFFSTTTDGTTSPTARVGYNSRRFSKPKSNTVDIDNQSNKQLEKKLEGFTEEERNRILSVLTQPSDCVNTSRVSDTSQRYVPELPPRNTTTDGYLNPVSLRDEDPHIYFEIPADEYI